MIPRPFRPSAAALLLVSCLSPDNPSSTIVRDSAGVRIAESPEASPDEWRLQLPPVLQIGRNEGEDDGPDLFGHIMQVIRLSSGDIAVAEGLANEIRIFDDGGGHLRTFGRNGEGPGEFTALWTIAELPGDTIVAVDPRGGRVSLFTSSGTFARSFLIPRLPGAAAPNVIGWLDDGTLLIDALTRSPSRDTRDQSTHFLYAVDRDGEVLGTLGEFAGQQLGRNGYPLVLAAARDSSISACVTATGIRSTRTILRTDPDRSWPTNSNRLEWPYQANSPPAPNTPNLSLIHI